MEYGSKMTKRMRYSTLSADPQIQCGALGFSISSVVATATATKWVQWCTTTYDIKVFKFSFYFQLVVFLLSRNLKGTKLVQSEGTRFEVSSVIIFAA